MIHAKDESLAASSAQVRVHRGRARVLAILSLVAVAGLPVLLLLVRFRVFTFRDDFTGFNALGFVIGWALILLSVGALLGALAWRADSLSWLARGALGLNLALLVFPLWLLAKLNGVV